MIGRSCKPEKEEKWSESLKGDAIKALWRKTMTNFFSFLYCREHVTCKEPIEVVSYKIGVCKVSSNGKDCHTDFQRLSYNGRTSVVLCKPRTGRMHQIRVHLQYLGKYNIQYLFFKTLSVWDYRQPLFTYHKIKSKIGDQNYQSWWLTSTEPTSNLNFT